MSSGGGVVGWIATAPLAAAVGTIVAGVLLVILFLFGILVLTATSLASVRNAVMVVVRSVGGVFTSRRARTEDADDPHETDPYDEPFLGAAPVQEEDVLHTSILEDEDRPAAILVAGMDRLVTVRVTRPSSSRKPHRRRRRAGADAPISSRRRTFSSPDRRTRAPRRPTIRSSLP